MLKTRVQSTIQVVFRKWEKTKEHGTWNLVLGVSNTASSASIVIYEWDYGEKRILMTNKSQGIN